MGNYPEDLVAPMRDELSAAGFRHLLSPGEVDAALARPGLSLLVVNSVCGCAAASARPGVREALGRGLKFDQLLTVFAGMEKDATQQAREYFEGAMATSPQVAILKDGQLLRLLQRSEFLDRGPEEIADRIEAAYRGALAEA
ncbi:MAG: BrxA/BrxB family bacilliredoxin [Acidobacteria bacterium]|nr:BrxA/BrxB family bacilliredoxin [Acidobacteriota bacterium]